MSAAVENINDADQFPMKVPLGRKTINDDSRAYKHTVRLSFAERLIKARESLGKTREDWMQEYNLGRSQIWQWETGKALPDLFILLRICEDNPTLSLDVLLRGVVPRATWKISAKVKSTRNKHLPDFIASE